MSTNRLHVSHYGTDVTREDLNHLFSAYGKVEQVECKSNYAFIEFANAPQADEARRKLDGHEFHGHVMTVQQAHTRREGERRRYDRYDDRDRYDRDRYDRDRYDYGHHYDSRYRHDRHRHHYEDEYEDRYDRRKISNNRHNPPHNSDYRVYITGLSRDYGWREIKDAFRAMSCEVCFADVRTTNGHIFGIAEFERPRDMNIALDQQTVTIGTLTCKVSEKNPYHRQSSPRRRSPDLRSPVRRSVDESLERSRSVSRSPVPATNYSPRSPES